MDKQSGWQEHPSTVRVTIFKLLGAVKFQFVTVSDLLLAALFMILRVFFHAAIVLKN